MYILTAALSFLQKICAGLAYCYLNAARICAPVLKLKTMTSMRVQVACLLDTSESNWQSKTFELWLQTYLRLRNHVNFEATPEVLEISTSKAFMAKINSRPMRSPLYLALSGHLRHTGCLSERRGKPALVCNIYIYFPIDGFPLHGAYPRVR